MATNPTRTLIASTLLCLLASPRTLAQEPASVETRLAAAKLHEARGELARAEAELQQAVAAAKEGQRAEVQDRLAELRRKMGGREAGDGAPVGPQDQDPMVKGDPVKRLIAVIDSGARTQGPGPVSEACAQLESLGALAVPILLKELPHLGPFGVTNALWVLRKSPDARIATALLSLMQDQDPAFSSVIAARLVDLPPEVGKPVATALADRELDAESIIEVFRALRRFASKDDVTKRLGLRLAAAPGTQSALLEALDKASDAGAGELLAAMMRQSTGSTRAYAAVRWMTLQRDLTEVQALEHLSRLDAGDQAWVAQSLVYKYPEWIDVGLVALRVVAWQPDEVMQSWFREAEWGRRPDVAGPALLALEVRRGSEEERAVGQAIRKVLSAGWQPPAAADEALAAILVGPHGDLLRAFVGAIPVGAEDRALAIWQRLDAANRRSFVGCAVELDRPWHRLVSRQLTTCEKWSDVVEALVDRDWSGAPAEAVAALVATVQRFPARPQGDWASWHGGVLKAYSRCRDLPAAVVLPMVRSNWTMAWRALAARHPLEALAVARELTTVTFVSHPELDVLLRDHGTVIDVPLALRLVRGPRHTTGRPLADQFLGRHARGRVDVLALAAGDTSFDGAMQMLARGAVPGLQASQLGELLPLMPGLHADVRNDVVEALEPQLRPEHGPQLVAAVQQYFAREYAHPDVLGGLLQWVGSSADPRCLGPLRQLLASATEERPYGAIAAAMIAVAGPERRAVVEELIASAKPDVVASAVCAAEVRADADLRAKARAAVLRVGAEAWFDDTVFKNLTADDAVDLARDVLSSEALPTFQQGLCLAALRTLRRAKVAGPLAPTIARGGLHPDAIVRERTAEALGNLFQREAAPFLVDLLKDESPDVRKLAQASLDQLAKYLDARADWEKRLK